MTDRLARVRDILLVGIGLLGFGVGLIVAHGERPTVLIVSAAMAMLPLFLRHDERKRRVDGVDAS